MYFGVISVFVTILALLFYTRELLSAIITIADVIQDFPATSALIFLLGTHIYAYLSGIPLDLTYFSFHFGSINTEARIFDSGASTNLVRKALSAILRSIPIKLAAGLRSVGRLSVGGEVEVDSGDILISAGRTVSAGARWTWTPDQCVVELGSEVLQLTIENQIPILTEDQEMKIRRFQATHFADVATTFQSSECVCSPSVYYLQSSCPAFDHFYQRDFQHLDFDSIIEGFSSVDILQFWQQSTGPKDFLFILECQVAHHNLARAEFEVQFSQIDNIVDVPPEKRASAQRKTPLEDILKHHQRTVNCWTIWADVYHSSQLSHDKCEYAWVFVASRLKPNHSQPPTRDDIEKVVAGYPCRENDTNNLQISLRSFLDEIGSPAKFFFQSEQERNSVTSVEFQTWITAAGGSCHFSVPYRHPGNEVYVRQVIAQTRDLLRTSGLPVRAWSHAMRCLWRFEHSVYPIRIWDKYTPSKHFGSLAFTKDRSNNIERLLPVLVLEPRPRDRVCCIIPTDKELGFRVTEMPFGNLTFSNRMVYTTHLQNLRISRFLCGEFAPGLVEKPADQKPKRLTCDACIRAKRQQKELHDNMPVASHTCDKGCNWQSRCVFESLFLQDVSFQPFTDPFFEMIKHVCDSKCDDPVEPEMHSVKPADVTPKLNAFHRCGEFIRQAPDAIKTSLGFSPFSTSETQATLFCLANHRLRDNVFHEIKTRSAHPDVQIGTKFFAVVLSHKQVVERCSSDQAALSRWVSSADKELANMLERGILRLVEWKDLQKLRTDGIDFECIPSIAIWSQKSSGLEKCRLVACGNHQKILAEDGDAYAAAVNVHSWRLLLAIFIQCKGSIFSCDVSEAFTQSRDVERVRTTFLKLPSQWKSKLCPIALREKGISVENFDRYLLEVLSTIYGEILAPKRWHATISRVLLDMGFRMCEWEESLFIHVSSGGVLTILTIYVDDIFGFSFSADFLTQTFERIRKEFKCTAVEVLCGPPADFSQNPLFKPVEGYVPGEWAVASPAQPMTYIAMDLYFKKSDDLCLILSQEKFFEKSFEKLREKGIASEFLPLYSLKKEDFQHQFLFEDVSTNPLLNKNELKLLRGGVNTLSYAAINTAYWALAPLGAIARGQVAGRQRHLYALRQLIRFSVSMSKFCLHIKVPSLPPISSLHDLKISLLGHFDASMGSSTPLGTDPFARHGFFLFVCRDGCDPVVFIGRSGLQSTIALSTCEAEITSSSWCAKQIVGFRNLTNDIFLFVPGNFICHTPHIEGDNQAANAIGMCKASARQLRHLQLPQLWVRRLTVNGELTLGDRRSADNSSDLVTKVMTRQSIESLLPLLQIRLV